MSIFINEQVKVELQQVLAKLVSPVKLIFFTQKNTCPVCVQQQNLLEEFLPIE